MFRRFLQTAVSLKKPLKSKIDRRDALMQDVNEAYKALKEERSSNLQKIQSCESLLKGQLPSLKWVLEEVEKCSNFSEISSLVPVLKEMRFLGAPKRVEVSNLFIKKLTEISEAHNDEKALLDILSEIVRFDQLNPLIVPRECSEDASEAYKTIIYTAHDLMSLK